MIYPRIETHGLKKKNSQDEKMHQHTYNKLEYFSSPASLARRKSFPERSPLPAQGGEAEWISGLSEAARRIPELKFPIFLELTRNISEPLKYDSAGALSTIIGQGSTH